MESGEHHLAPITRHWNWNGARRRARKPSARSRRGSPSTAQSARPWPWTPKVLLFIL